MANKGSSIAGRREATYLLIPVVYLTDVGLTFVQQTLSAGRSKCNGKCLKKKTIHANQAAQRIDTNQRALLCSCPEQSACLYALWAVAKAMKHSVLVLFDRLCFSREHDYSFQQRRRSLQELTFLHLLTHHDQFEFRTASYQHRDTLAQASIASHFLLP